jgi:hypothetical protein
MKMIPAAVATYATGFAVSMGTLFIEAREFDIVDEVVGDSSDLIKILQVVSGVTALGAN